MIAICKYLNQNGDCLQMCYGNSRGLKLTSGRETIGKERRKETGFFTEFNLSWFEDWWGLDKDVEMGIQSLIPRRGKSIYECVTTKRRVRCRANSSTEEIMEGLKHQDN